LLASFPDFQTHFVISPPHLDNSLSSYLAEFGSERVAYQVGHKGEERTTRTVHYFVEEFEGEAVHILLKIDLEEEVLNQIRGRPVRLQLRVYLLDPLIDLLWWWFQSEVNEAKAVFRSFRNEKDNLGVD